MYERSAAKEMMKNIGNFAKDAFKIFYGISKNMNKLLNYKFYRFMIFYRFVEIYGI
tara:strand:+ start:347 stop:514 length:168 start_codon:yes stop_codon:yes gene_type:complete